MTLGNRLVCRELVCGYPSRTVLPDVNLELSTGEVVALLGPNGSGKSTLLKTLVGTLKPLGGELTIDEREAHQLTSIERARLVSYVPQDEHSPFAFTAKEIVLMGRMPYSTGLADTPDDYRAAQEAMELADCTDFADRPIDELSGGERQRVWIARALAQGAPVLLLDEPTSHFDVGHQVVFVKLLKKLASSGISICIALHDLTIAGVVADRAVLLDRGQIAKVGQPAEVLTGPIMQTVYGCEFETVTASDGLLRVLPRL